MTYRPRSDWSQPADGLAPLDPADVRGVAVHWLGPPMSLRLGIPKALQAIHRFHTGRRGWSDIAYNFAVSPDGDVWELRGMHSRSGANGNRTANERYIAVCALLGEGEHPTPAMLDGIRTAVRMVRDAYPHATEIKPHYEVRGGGTDCPGPDLIHCIKTGDLEPREEEIDMTREELAAIVSAEVAKSLRTEGVSGVPQGVAHALRTEGVHAKLDELVEHARADKPAGCRCACGEVRETTDAPDA